MAAKGGRKTRAGGMFRSGIPNDTGVADMAMVAGSLGVRTLVDLRQFEEHAKFPIRSAWTGKAMTIPLLGPTAQSMLFPSRSEAYVDFLRRPPVGPPLGGDLALPWGSGHRTGDLLLRSGQGRTGLVTAAILAT